MKIKDKFKEAEESTQKHWRGIILSNYALLQCYQWFELLESQRPEIRMIDNSQTVDDGKPIENIHYIDIQNLHFGFNPIVIMNEVKLHDFLEWFLELEEETFYEETEEGWSNWLDFTYMARAFNHFVTEV